MAPPRYYPIFSVWARKSYCTGQTGSYCCLRHGLPCGLVASYQIEQLAGIPCRAEIASEYRYRKPVVPENTLFIAVSQSGETADTLAALKHAKQAGYVTTLAICNVAESSVVREADLVLMTRAGPEIGVASTKAFTTQLVALQLLVLELARLNGVDEAEYADYVGDLHRLPELLNEASQSR